MKQKGMTDFRSYPAVFFAPKQDPIRTAFDGGFGDLVYFNVRSAIMANA